MDHSSGHKQWEKIVLFIFASLLTTSLLVSTSCVRQAELPRWEYNQFIQAVEQNQVQEVVLSADHAQALVTIQEGEQVLVHLPNDPNLLNTLTQNDVDVSVLPQINQDVFPLALPVLVLGGVVVIVGLLFWLWVLIDCATQESSEGNTKIIWILIVLFANGIGALIYFLIRRPQRRRELGR